MAVGRGAQPVVTSQSEQHEAGTLSPSRHRVGVSEFTPSRPPVYRLASMPRSRCGETWQNCSAPQTGLQRNVFMDKCTDWFVRMPLKDALPGEESRRVFEPERRTQFHQTMMRHPPATSIGLTHTELRMHTARPCAFCDADDAQPVMANPFAQRGLVLVCLKCRGC